MIVKVFSRTSTSKRVMQELIDYVFRPEKLKDAFLDREPLIVKRYIRGYDTDKWAMAFKTNDDNRTFEHSKRTVLRHEIISFSPKDNHVLTREKLQVFGKWYLKHRSPSSLGVCGAHYEESIHLHFIISGVGIDKKSTRISRKEFKDFKIKLQEFQQSKFPELTHSIVQHSSKKKA